MVGERRRLETDWEGLAGWKRLGGRGRWMGWGGLESGELDGPGEVGDAAWTMGAGRVGGWVSDRELRAKEVRDGWDGGTPAVGVGNLRGCWITALAESPSPV